MDKTQKYDRQLRLWGAHGQEALESANVLLIGATSTGCETLKNLILPGIGSYTVVDDAKVSAGDAGNNFFIEKAHIGCSRAQVVAGLLNELNSDVNGAYIDQVFKIKLVGESIRSRKYDWTFLLGNCNRSAASNNRQAEHHL